MTTAKEEDAASKNPKDDSDPPEMALRAFFTRHNIAASRLDPSSAHALNDMFGVGLPNTGSTANATTGAAVVPNEQTSIESGANRLGTPTATTTKPEEKDKDWFEKYSCSPPSPPISASATAAAVTDTTTTNNNNNNSNNYTIPEDATPTERIILEQLACHSMLLMDLHRRLDQMAIHNSNNTIANTNDSIHAQKSPHSQPISPQQAAAIVLAAVQRGGGGGANPGLLPSPAPTPIPAAAAVPFWTRGLLTRVRQSKTARILSLYWALRHRHRQQQVQNNRNRNRNNNDNMIIWDPLMILKVLVMAAIVVSRVTNKRRPHPHQHLQKDSTPAKSTTTVYYWYYVSLVAMAGALAAYAIFVRTGLLKFWYQFCFQYRYPARIWKGEDVAVDEAWEPFQQQIHEEQLQVAIAAALQRQHPAGAAAAPIPDQNNNNRFPPDWMRALVFGAPPPPPPPVAGTEPNPPPPPPPAPMVVLRWLQDFVVLLGSFFLSIFPMWRAMAPPPRHPVAIGNNNIPEQQQHALPEVRPPLDPAGFDEEEEDDGEDDDDDDEEGSDEDDDALDE